MPSVPGGTPYPRATFILPARRTGPGHSSGRRACGRGAHVRLLPRHAATRTRLRRYGRLPVIGRRLAPDAAPGLSALLRHCQYSACRAWWRTGAQPEPDLGPGRRRGMRRHGLGGLGDHGLDSGRRLGGRASWRVLHLLVAGCHRRGVHPPPVADLARACRGPVVAPTAVTLSSGAAPWAVRARLWQPSDDDPAGAGAGGAYHPDS